MAESEDRALRRWGYRLPPFGRLELPDGFGGESGSARDLAWDLGGGFSDPSAPPGPDLSRCR